MDRDIPTSRRVRVRNSIEASTSTITAPVSIFRYDFVVAPGARPRAIRLHVDNAVVQKRSTGELVFHTAAGDIVQRRPVAYQISRGVRHEVTADYEISGADITFAVADYDVSRPLVIDPVLLVATYLGGSDTDQANAVAFGPDGLFIAGSTVSPDFADQRITVHVRRAGCICREVLHRRRNRSVHRVLRRKRQRGGSRPRLRRGPRRLCRGEYDIDRLAGHRGRAAAGTGRFVLFGTINPTGFRALLGERGAGPVHILRG